jgi:toxin ParE1/3/4
VRRASFLPSAKIALVELRIYLTKASGSRNVPRKFIARLRDHCHYLASLPFEMGKSRPELGPEMRSANFENYVILFRYHEDRFEIVNIIEGHRDLSFNE